MLRGNKHLVPEGARRGLGGWPGFIKSRGYYAVIEIITCDNLLNFWNHMVYLAVTAELWRGGVGGNPIESGLVKTLEAT